jgi:hypothetical protein
MRNCVTVAGLFVCMLARPQTADDSKSKEIYARNRIKNQISWDYAYVDNKPGKNGVKTSVTQFSVAGNIAQVIAYNPKGQVINVEKYNYDAHGNKTEYSRFQGSADTKAAYQKISKFNAQDKLTEETGYDGVENFNNTYKYDDQGVMTEIRYLKNNHLSEKRVFTKSGNSTAVSIYNATGVMTSKLLLRYDTHNNLVEEVVYGLNESELEKKTYHYDENKNLKEEAKYKLDKITLKTSYSYNASGNLLEISEELPGAAKYIKKSFTYDPKENLLEIKWRRKDKEEFNQITYTYDDKGLCTKAMTWYPATKYRVLTQYTYEVY